MNVASLELSKELYAASWIPEFLCPAYDLGYLLRKLPDWYETPGVEDKEFGMACLIVEKRKAGYMNNDTGQYVFNVAADTPEDTLCKLAIELFKQNILQPSVTDKESV